MRVLVISLSSKQKFPSVLTLVLYQAKLVKDDHPVGLPKGDLPKTPSPPPLMDRLTKLTLSPLPDKLEFL
jgi:hypothetical protein